MGEASTDRLLGVFGAGAAVVATIAFATDGWSDSEIVAAVIIWGVAVSTVAYIFRDDIQDFWYGVANDDVNPATVNDAEAIHSLALSYFGDQITPVNQIKSLIYRHKKMFWILANKRSRKTVTSVDGYVCFFPLAQQHVADLEALKFTVADLTSPSLPKKRSETHAVYIGAVVGSNYRAKAKLLMFVEERSKQIARSSHTRCVYAKAATRPGLRMLKKKEFVPVRQGYDGINCFYKKAMD